jgi:hypothetical protein
MRRALQILNVAECDHPLEGRSPEEDGERTGRVREEGTNRARPRQG